MQLTPYAVWAFVYQGKSDTFEVLTRPRIYRIYVPLRSEITGLHSVITGIA
jgi:hypothetical protein